MTTETVIGQCEDLIDLVEQPFYLLRRYNRITKCLMEVGL